MLEGGLKFLIFLINFRLVFLSLILVAHSKEVRIFACYALFPCACRASMEMVPYMALAQCLRDRSCRLTQVLRKDDVLKGEFDLRTSLFIEDYAHCAFSGNRSKTYPSISDFSYSSVGN